MKNAQGMAILYLLPQRGSTQTVLLAGVAPTNKLLPQGAGGEEGGGHGTHILISNFLCVAFKTEEGVRY